jgi:NhaP-type Na+/H+ or K+/H+ antiporter
MVILLLTPVDSSVAETFKIPFSSIEYLTLILGVPLGAGGIPLNSNLPRRLLSFVIARSPS